MNNNTYRKIISTNRPNQLARISRRRLFNRLATLVVFGAFLPSSAVATELTRAGNGSLRAGSFEIKAIVVCDSGGSVYLFDPQTQQRVIIFEDKRGRPYDVTVDGHGNFIISDSALLRIVMLDAVTREPIVLIQGPDVLGVPYGLDADKQNRVFVANGQKILCIDLDTRSMETTAEAGLLKAPLDVAVAPDGNLYVADALAGVIRIDRASKQQSLVVKGGLFLRSPLGISIHGNRNLLVTDPSAQCIVEINLQDNSQRLISKAGFLKTPVAIAQAPGGTILVSYPDAFGLNGGIIAIDKDGSQTLVMRGFDDLVNARGIAIVSVRTDAPEKLGTTR